ncbi:MAG TPA: hypothetical protein VL832_27005 [Puia sp.]|nr:hypothetical protein [Puia sp.]
MKLRTVFLLFPLLLLLRFSSSGSGGSAGTPVPEISLVTDAAMGTPAHYGLDKLTLLLTAKHISYEKVTALEQARGKYLLVVGLADGNGPTAVLLKTDSRRVPREPEALTIRHRVWRQKQLVVIGGSDNTGLLYALLEATRQIGLTGTGRPLLSGLKDVTEKPAMRDRALSIYTMNRAYWESRFYDENYWSHYLDMMAENRFNSLVVIFGYENGGFLAPCYPYFFNVDGYPNVQMVGLSEQEQQRNLSAINKLIQMAHVRGIRFTAGIWDHIYRGGVQGGGIPGSENAPDHPTPGLVWGLTADNLTAYTKAALATFIRQIPLDAIQFRMHGESGLKKEEEESFWADVFKMIRQDKPDLQIDMRAKELPRSVIQSALNAGIKFRIATKVWMEQLGLPYHPTRINPEKSYIRHSYGDLLRYPKQYQMVWRLWNGGTSRVLLWGDPEYARRFMRSAHLYDGDAYEVNEPLATKMEAQPHDANPFDLLQPQHRYYQYEFERYWHFFQVFGRIGYNPQTPSEVWDKEFAVRLGKVAGPLAEKALHRASGILPRIIASCYPYSYFPMTRGWAEKQRLGDLPSYAKTEASDLCQFASFDDEAALLITHGETARIRPSANSQWFANTAREVLGLITQLKSVEPDPNKELSSTLADLGILANLSLYHSRRIPAAVYYRLYERTHDITALDSAIAYESLAIRAWRQIVVSAGDYYTDNLQMGVSVAGLCGHWKDELAALEAGLVKLQQQRQNADPHAMTARAPVFEFSPARPIEDLFTIHLLAPDSIPAGQPVSIRMNVTAPAGVKWIRLHYRALNQQLEYKDLPMEPAGNPNEFRATIPAGDIDPTYDLIYYVELMDKHGNGRIYPDLNKETPYRIITLIRAGK